MDIHTALITRGGLLAHAPTGLGKTAAALSPALAYALEHKKVVFFLTSRHTQHKIAIETLAAIRAKHGISFGCTDLIGKKWMCLVPGISTLHSGDFGEYCRKVREENSCGFYSATKENSKLTIRAKALVEELRKMGPLQVHEIVQESSQQKMCPYEIAVDMGKDAHVVIADYFYVFNPTIFSGFLAKIGKDVSDCIVIVDEAHNLPGRLRDLLTSKLSSFIVSRAVKEATRNNMPELAGILSKVGDILFKLAEGVKDEKVVRQEHFEDELRLTIDIKQLIGDLAFAADMIRVSQRSSFMGTIANFLEAWQNDEPGFVRYLDVKNTANGKVISLYNKCLDPSLLTKPVIEQSHSTIMMSGTLTPVEMYRDLLGFDPDTPCKVYPSPFPKENRLTLIVPQTSTRFAARSDEQYAQIAGIVTDIVNQVPGNSAVFFPSYELRDRICKSIARESTKTTFFESPGLTNVEKHELLEKFKSYHKSGAVLLGVAGGSFGEGIDLPGDFLKAVVVVGLPLKQPNIEAKALIEYYDRMFGKGWDYGYTYPCLNMVMQAAGRCIRTKTDRGVIIFLDERYAWNKYLGCFPGYWDTKITGLYKERIKEFFGKLGT